MRADIAATPIACVANSSIRTPISAHPLCQTPAMYCRYRTHPSMPSAGRIAELAIVEKNRIGLCFQDSFIVDVSMPKPFIVDCSQLICWD